jgi:hypothetical protein
MRLIAAVLIAGLGPTLALADDTPPPANAMKLSAVIAALEDRLGQDLAFVDEVEWDDDGYWEVEYHGPLGASTKVKLDAVTGEMRN